MSHTRRRAAIDTEPKRPDTAFMGIAFAHKPTAKEVREAHQDGKPHHKPSKRVKGYLSKGAKAKTRRQLAAVVDNPDDAPMPRDVKDHVWLFN